ncbi:MAG: hypothetical protein IPM29_17635 [Planctomycetes bacterium]|nr:hypothetical protein [Planctomycetota bacterium]
MRERAELLHRRSAVDGAYLATMFGEEFAGLEPRRIVTPPTGLEIGCVPIVVEQRDRCRRCAARREKVPNGDFRLRP